MGKKYYVVFFGGRWSVSTKRLKRTDRWYFCKLDACRFADQMNMTDY